MRLPVKLNWYVSKSISISRWIGRNRRPIFNFPRGSSLPSPAPELSLSDPADWCRHYKEIPLIKYRE